MHSFFFFFCNQNQTFFAKSNSIFFCFPDLKTLWNINPKVQFNSNFWHFKIFAFKNCLLWNLTLATFNSYKLTWIQTIWFTDLWMKNTSKECFNYFKGGYIFQNALSSTGEKFEHFHISLIFQTRNTTKRGTKTRTDRYMCF